MVIDLFSIALILLSSIRHFTKFDIKQANEGIKKILISFFDFMITLIIILQLRGMNFRLAYIQS